MINQFLGYLRYELNRAPLTVDAYKNDLTQFEDWLKQSGFDKKNLEEVSSKEIRAWMTFRNKCGDSHRTIRRKLISFRTFYKWLIKSGVISHSPLRDIPLPKISKPLPELIRSDEIEFALQNNDEVIADTYEESLQNLIVELLYSLGIRRAELIGLNDTDISFEKAEIKVTGKRSKQRVIPVPEKLLNKIKEFRKIRDLEEIIDDSTDVPLFIVKGKRISEKQVYMRVRNVLENTSAKKKSPHALRHSFASSMLNSGAEIDSVREFLGHSSLATTQIYTHITFNEIKKAYSSAHPRSGRKEK